MFFMLCKPFLSKRLFAKIQFTNGFESIRVIKSSVIADFIICGKDFLRLAIVRI